MSLNMTYSFREGVLGLKRARIATTLAITIITVVFFTMSIFLSLTLNIQHIIGRFQTQLEMEVFIDNSIAQNRIENLKSQLSVLPGVEKIRFISKDDALAIFKKEFGKDPLELLGENPLPASFRVEISSDTRGGDATDLLQKIQNLDGVEDVQYNKRLYNLIYKFSRIVYFIDAGFLIVVLLSSTSLVANTLRLTVLAQRKTIHIMQLVGATLGFIRRPFVIQGMLQGGIGGSIAAIIFYGLVQVVSLRFPYLLKTSPVIFLTPVFLGLLLGLIGSRIGLKRFLRVF